TSLILETYGSYERAFDSARPSLAAETICIAFVI
ncbi:hypothetical protein NT04LS_2909, partial [Listeria seeligeri FSL S4-171]